MAIITLAKVDECKGVIVAHENDAIDDICHSLQNIGLEAKRLCEQMENGLRPGGVWRPWCDANMTAAEKQWFIAAYLELKNIRDRVA